MLRSFLTAASLIAMGACSASALPQTPEAPLQASPVAAIAPAPVIATPRAIPASYDEAGGVECVVRETATRNGVRLEAMARGDRDAYGEYEFVITKGGAGGSSDIVQGGEFDLAQGQQTLGEAEFNMERRDYFRARLVLRDGQGIVCRDELRS